MNAQPPLTKPPVAQGIPVPHCSPLLAALLSMLIVGGGQTYCKRLEQGMLLFIVMLVAVGSGLVVLLAMVIGAVLPDSWPQPPLLDVVHKYRSAALWVWLGTCLLIWALNVVNAWFTAVAVNRRQIIVRYPLRRQLVHVLASQLLAFIPVIGFLFPPGLVAEAIDAAKERRSLKRETVLSEEKAAVLEWAALRAVVIALIGLGAVIVVWWIVRIVVRLR